MDSIFDTEIFRSVYGIAIAILFFGGTVFVHELGHYLAAKKRGLKVERFSIGFGPRVWGWTGKDGVDYRISLFPLGGYVALPQMADMRAVEGATDDAEALPKIGYADKMIVAVMGATFNVLFAIVLACILWVIGVPGNSAADQPVIGRVERELVINDKGDKVPAPAWKAELQIGDRILSVDGKPIATFSEFMAAMALGVNRDADKLPVVSLVVERDGKTLAAPVVLHPVLADNDGTGDARRMIGIGAARPVRVDISKSPESVAAKAGLKTGDRIVAINDVKIYDFDQFKDAIGPLTEPAVFKVERMIDGKRTVLPVTVRPEERNWKNPTLTLEFDEGDQRRSLVMVASPEFPEFTVKALNKSPLPPRTVLMVCEPLPSDSAYASKLPVGTVVYGVSGAAGVFRRTADIEGFRKRVEDSKGEVTLFVRDEKTDSNLALHKVVATVKPLVKRRTVDGIAPRTEPGDTEHYPPWVYLAETFDATWSTLRALVSPGSDVGVRHLSGVIGIAHIYYSIADSIRMLLRFTILINVNLAILNLLPLPVLDGGHMVYATLEKIRGRPLPLRVVEIVQTTFVVILFGLMAFVLTQDFRRLSSDGSEIRKAYADRLRLVDRSGDSDK